MNPPMVPKSRASQWGLLLCLCLTFGSSECLEGTEQACISHQGGGARSLGLLQVSKLNAKTIIPSRRNKTKTKTHAHVLHSISGQEGLDFLTHGHPFQLLGAQEPAAADDRWTYHVEIPVVIVIICGGILSIFGSNQLSRYMTASGLGYLACAAYVSISVTIDLSIAVQKQTDPDTDTYEFDPVCCVLLVETVKLIVSLTLYFSHRDTSTQTMPSMTDISWLMLPAFLYTLNNILVWYAIGENDASTFGVFRDTMIMWTAMIWRCVFRTPLGFCRLFAIGIVFMGLVMNRVTDMSGETMMQTAVFLVLIMTLCNSLGSVSNEFAMKRSYGLSIDLQNSVLYSGCIGFTLLLLLASPDGVDKITHPSAIFKGFTHHTMFTVFLQACSGLMISRILKYADSVQKNVAACLRGPALVVIAPYFLESKSDAATLGSAFVVAVGCLTYLAQGPLSTNYHAEQAANKGSPASETRIDSRAQRF